jgi:DNA-binding response OmpR family regulator
MRAMLTKLLTSEGMRVSEAHDARSMYNAILQSRPDLILLDLMLPDEDGMAALRRVGSDFEGGIIIVSMRNDVIDRVAGLEAGADDYICKPTHPRELLARVRAVLRRVRPSLAHGHHDEPPVITFEGFELNRVERRLISPSGAPVELTSNEFELLLVLTAHPGRALSRDYLMDQVRKRDWIASDRSIDQHISRLRRKIEGKGAATGLIRSVRGIGYVFAAKVSSK